jgi:subtilisin-like proprotein convertase family protein
VQRIIEKENTTPLAIPDNFTPGIASTLEISESGPIVGVEVAVDITHTWIGDLQVALISPQGTRVLVHNRAGGSRDNLRQTYTLADTSAMEAFVNEPAQGEWTLVVADRARRDEGTLNRWRLKLALSQDQRIHVTSTESLTIPDDDIQGITSQLLVDHGGPMQHLAISVDVTHSWIGDLRISLVAPSGQEVVLHDRSGVSADNIQEVYDPLKVPELAALLQNGQPALGLWTLKVADLARRDVGKLNTWGLDITLA